MTKVCQVTEKVRLDRTGRTIYLIPDNRDGTVVASCSVLIFLSGGSKPTLLLPWESG